MGSADPLAETIAAGLPPPLARAYLLLICLSVFVCALSIQAATVRIAFGMARDGQLPGSRLVCRVSPRFGTPVLATVLVGALAALPLLATQHVAVLAAGATGLIYLAYLLAGIELPEKAPVEVKDFLGVDLASIDRDGAAAVVVDIREVVVDDLVALADHAHSAGAAHVAAEEKVSLDGGVVTVPQRERGLGVAKRVVAIDVVAGLVRDRLVLAVDALE